MFARQEQRFAPRAACLTIAGNFVGEGFLQKLSGGFNRSLQHS